MEEDAKGLMRGFVRGDRAVVEQIIRLYGDSLFGYLVKMSGDRETAEDYFQETIGRVCEKATSFRGGNLRAWIFRIATNVAMDGFRKEKKRAMLGLNQIQDCDGANEVAVADSKDISSPSEDAQRQEQKEMVQRIIEELPAGQRTILVLNYYQQLSYSEVAEVMNCTTGTVKTQMYRALRKIADKLPDRDNF
jgi:RNA polymerase sigma-70 factor (ECF subfamily)